VRSFASHIAETRKNAAAVGAAKKGDSGAAEGGIFLYDMGFSSKNNMPWKKPDINFRGLPEGVKGKIADALKNTHTQWLEPRKTRSYSKTLSKNSKHPSFHMQDDQQL
jgi:hypothetical protein